MSRQTPPRRSPSATTSKPVNNKPKKKPSLHSRNVHRNGYDFAELTTACPELKGYLVATPRGEQSIDFANPDAVKCLNQALLLRYYGIQYWDLPPGYLCPPVPGRVDYLHHLADLLARDAGGSVPQGKKVKVLDIGTGANLIYPIVGLHSYGWKFVGAEVDPVALGSAQLIAASNPSLKNAITVRRQKNAEHIFTGIIRAGEQLDLTLCNPPFHASAGEAKAGTQRKLKNLGERGAGKKQPVLNFGGQANELWCPGGERGFVSRMIEESQQYAQQVCWFSSLISKRENVAPLRKVLSRVGAERVEVIPMAQGNKLTRVLAWSFLTAEQAQAWAAARDS